MSAFNKKTINEKDTDRLFRWIKLYAESRVQKLKVKLSIEERQDIVGDAVTDAAACLINRDTDLMQSPMAYVCRTINTRIGKATNRVVKVNQREASMITHCNDSFLKHIQIQGMRAYKDEHCNYEDFY